MPSGESLVRQFLHGQRFFEEEFGRRCTEFWLPDTFGYSAQARPPIAGPPHLPCSFPRSCTVRASSSFSLKSSGTPLALQFLFYNHQSWNLFNKPTMHSFLWEGLDGTRLFTHFPPADTYNAEADVNDVLKSAANYNGTLCVCVCVCSRASVRERSQ